jgi:hypothetical protein
MEMSAKRSRYPRALCACALTVSSLAAYAARAQAEPDAPPAPPAEEAAASAGTRSYDFDDELVSGDLASPLGERLSVRWRGARASLIELRTSYLDKLVRSVEDL